MMKYIIEDSKHYFVEKINESNYPRMTWNYLEAIRFDTEQDAWNFIAKYHIPYASVGGLKIEEDEVK